MVDIHTQEQQLKELLQKRLAELPVAVQNAIKSVDVPTRLQTLSKTHQLHVDQWQILENEVMLTILGFQPADELAGNIQKQVGLPADIVQTLTDDIGRVIFNPIREELERELGHPQAKEEELSDMEKMQQEALSAVSSEERGTSATQVATPEVSRVPLDTSEAPKPPAPTPAPTPGTPPAPPPTEKAVRAPASGAYVPGETSAARADVHDDPYRVPPA